MCDFESLRLDDDRQRQGEDAERGPGHVRAIPPDGDRNADPLAHPERLGKLAVFEGVRNYPARVKCASLPGTRFAPRSTRRTRSCRQKRSSVTDGHDGQHHQAHRGTRARTEEEARVASNAGATAGANSSVVTPFKTLTMQPQIVEVLSTIFDPEIPVNIYELGLIYEIAVDSDNVVGIRMTLTAPGCPAAQSLPVEVVNKLKQLPGITDAHVDIVWDPPWDKDRMSDAAKLQLGMF